MNIIGGSSELIHGSSNRLNTSSSVNCNMITDYNNNSISDKYFNFENSVVHSPTRLENPHESLSSSGSLTSFQFSIDETDIKLKKDCNSGVSISAVDNDPFTFDASDKLSKLTIGNKLVDIDYAENRIQNVEPTLAGYDKCQYSGATNLKSQLIDNKRMPYSSSNSLLDLFPQHHSNTATNTTGLPLSYRPSSNVSSPCSSLSSTPRSHFNPYALPRFSMSPAEFMSLSQQQESMAFFGSPPSTPSTSSGYFISSREVPPYMSYNQSAGQVQENYYAPDVANLHQSNGGEDSMRLTRDAGIKSNKENVDQSCTDIDNGIKAVVEEEGYISLHLRFDVIVDIAPNQGVRIINHRKRVSMSLSGCGTSMALIHPQGRVLQYNSRIEVQAIDQLSYPQPVVKNAKMWPRGVSFSATNYALVYLVDQAGARTTTDSFHDLYASNISDSVFIKSCEEYNLTGNPTWSVEKSIRDLEAANYWRTEADLDCWVFDQVKVTQTQDGLVSVERKYGEEVFILKASPNNGKARLQSSFMYLTASMGEESHLFVKSNDRRIHYNGKAFVVRNAGHSAGFDEEGRLRIW